MVSLEMSRVLLGLLIRHLDRGEGPLIFGIDETLERPALDLTDWLGRIPWAGRCWALPFLTVLATSERYYRRQGRPHSSRTGPVRWYCNSAAGCPAGHWCWWGTAATLSWACSISADSSGCKRCRRP